MTEDRKTVTVEVFNLTDNEWTMTVPKLIAWLEERISRVPEEFRDLVKVVATERYEVGFEITASYERPETDAELGARIDRDKFWEEDRQKRDRRLYEQLKAKFG